jgi:transposase-like protein
MLPEGLFEALPLLMDEGKCRELFEKIRWKGQEPWCPYSKCNHVKVYRFKNGIHFKCAKCRKRFTVTVGTVLQDSKIPLQKWMLAIYLLTTGAKGLASCSLAVHLGVTQSTAWYIQKRVEELVKNIGNGKNKFTKNAPVEVDEAFVGGKDKNRRDDLKGYKFLVLGMIQKNGNVFSRYIPNRFASTLQIQLRDKIEPGAEIISDSWRGYNGLSGDYTHVQVKDKEKGSESFIVNGRSTNHIENYWTRWKKTYHGAHHWFSKKHVNSYCQLIDFRHNTRKLSVSQKITLALSEHNGKNINYKELTKHNYYISMKHNEPDELHNESQALTGIPGDIILKHLRVLI